VFQLFFTLTGQR